MKVAIFYDAAESLVGLADDAAESLVGVGTRGRFGGRKPLDPPFSDLDGGRRQRPIRQPATMSARTIFPLCDVCSLAIQTPSRVK